MVTDGSWIHLEESIDVPQASACIMVNSKAIINTQQDASMALVVTQSGERSKFGEGTKDALLFTKSVGPQRPKMSTKYLLQEQVNP